MTWPKGIKPSEIYTYATNQSVSNALRNLKFDILEFRPPKRGETYLRLDTLSADQATWDFSDSEPRIVLIGYETSGVLEALQKIWE